MEKVEIHSKEDLTNYLKSGNKDARKNSLIAQKKSIIKHGDGIPYFPYDFKGNAFKANEPLSGIPTQLKVRAIINTTNLMDSHYDVHYPGLWSKSLKENGMIMHVQEHKSYEFSGIISDGQDLKAYTKTYSWSELGLDFKGVTEALVFDSIVKREGEEPRNVYMFDQYRKGYVKQHSVGMQYIKMVLCVNEPDNEYYGAEFEAWEKYFPEVVNQEYALEKGFFWLIKEAKVIEGSAVPRGSNWATPTLDNNLKREPSDHSRTEPSNDTQKAIDYGYLAENFKLNF